MQLIKKFLISLLLYNIILTQAKDDEVSLCQDCTDCSTLLYDNAITMETIIEELEILEKSTITQPLPKNFYFHYTVRLVNKIDSCVTEIVDVVAHLMAHLVFGEFSDDPKRYLYYKTLVILHKITKSAFLVNSEINKDFIVDLKDSILELEALCSQQLDSEEKLFDMGEYIIEEEDTNDNHKLMKRLIEGADSNGIISDQNLVKEVLGLIKNGGDISELGLKVITYTMDGGLMQDNLTSDSLSMHIDSIIQNAYRDNKEGDFLSSSHGFTEDKKSYDEHRQEGTEYSQDDINQKEDSYKNRLHNGYEKEDSSKNRQDNSYEKDGSYDYQYEDDGSKNRQDKDFQNEDYGSKKYRQNSDFEIDSDFKENDGSSKNRQEGGFGSFDEEDGEELLI